MSTRNNTAFRGERKPENLTEPVRSGHFWPYLNAKLDLAPRLLRLSQIQLKIRLLQEEAERVREQDMQKEVELVLESASPEELIPVASDLYWYCPVGGELVTRAFRKYSNKSFVPDPEDVEVPCRKCRREFEVFVYSWEQYNQVTGYSKFVCPRCEDSPDFDEAPEEAEGGTTRLAEIARLRAMPYADYLQTEHWKSVRAAEVKQARHRCRLCNSDGKLNVHHRTYERRGCELPDDVIALCRPCHRKFHDILPGPSDGEGEG